MTKLKEELHKNDYLINLIDKEVFFIIKIDDNSVWVRSESVIKDEKEPDDANIHEYPKSYVNRTLVKIEKDLVNTLYRKDNEQKI